MKLAFNIPESKKIRLIVNTDAKNEADDQFAIAHALLTPQFIIKGLIAAHFGSEKSPTSMLDSYDEIHKVLQLMGMEGAVPVVKGASHAMTEDQVPVLSEGSDLIIQEALSDDPRPLYVIFLGPLTDLAAAYMKEPAIANKLTAVWIGGGAWPNGGQEYNLSNDIHAANVVLQSTIPLWQVPMNAYITVRVSIAELIYKVKPCGEIGAYLVQQLMEMNEAWGDNPAWPRGEMWALGDSPAVSLLMNDLPNFYTMRPAPRINADNMQYEHYQQERLIRVYDQVDVRFTLEDMFAKLALHYA
jgi:purine nucleosidase